ncbi:type II toxin-antitoxin system Phd/YefM family antitoxin [Thalassovita sp.]|uniref:type II toxin-antitoxin system Phd/YefM family antitoxin n=1 Tax=Thalassovita sp. TaxID=1979401 RepID=UPI0029DE60F1|nr:type II toxin-antitoxin system Phd/YefM family antitoxin [Thalassovita sp.]
MTRLTPHRIISLTEFRQAAGDGMNWVQHQGNRLWITRHGRAAAALVPMNQCELLETWETRSLKEERHRMERMYARWKRVKARDPGAAGRFSWELE